MKDLVELHALAFYMSHVLELLDGRSCESQVSGCWWPRLLKDRFRLGSRYFRRDQEQKIDR